jgi:hypothetical protein
VSIGLIAGIDHARTKDTIVAILAEVSIPTDLT